MFCLYFIRNMCTLSNFLWTKGERTAGGEWHHVCTESHHKGEHWRVGIIEFIYCPITSTAISVNESSNYPSIMFNVGTWSSTMAPWWECASFHFNSQNLELIPLQQCIFITLCCLFCLVLDFPWSTKPVSDSLKEEEWCWNVPLSVCTAFFVFNSVVVVVFYTQILLHLPCSGI